MQLPPQARRNDSLEPTRTAPDQLRGARFDALGLGNNIVRELAVLGAEEPTPIQAVTIPETLAGRDVLGRARTGSGKTVAFAAPLIERLLRLKAEGAFRADPAAASLQRGKPARSRAKPPGRAPKALILAPTRELALQVDETVRPIARSVGFYTAQLVGGVPFEPQLHALGRGVDIVIGTPGRILDLAQREHLDLRGVLISVIDEADHLCDLGFLEPVQQILRRTARRGQRLLFSATLDEQVEELVSEFLRTPAVHEIVEERGHGSQHHVLIVLREHKDAALVELAASGERVIVFCRTRSYAEHVAAVLHGAGITAVELHGDLGQPRRTRNLERFAAGRASVLVATDVAARGIHVPDVDLVLQADPPDGAKTYLHRAGRTGRTGSGRVLTVIPRTGQRRTRDLFEELGFTPNSFADFAPGDPPPGTALAE